MSGSPCEVDSMHKPGLWSGAAVIGCSGLAVREKAREAEFLKHGTTQHRKALADLDRP